MENAAPVQQVKVTPEKAPLHIDIAEIRYPNTKINSFFGDLSHFQIMVSAVALTTGLWTFAVVPIYRCLKRRPLRLFCADSAGVVWTANNISALNLRVAMTNRSHKTVTLTRLDGAIETPLGKNVRITWLLFFRYTGRGVERESEVYPVAIAPQDSKAIFVQMVPENRQQFIESINGLYTLKLWGYINGLDRSSVFQIRRFYLDEKDTEQAKKAALTNEPNVYTVDLKS